MREPAEIARRAKDAAGGIRDAGRRITANPVLAVLSALVAGFFLGLVLRIFERAERVREEK